MCWVGGSRFRSFCYLEGCPMFLSRVEAPERVALHLPVVQEEFRALPTCNLVPPLHLCKRKVQGPGAYSKAVLCPALSHDLEREGRREARVHTCATHTPPQAPSSQRFRKRVSASRLSGAGRATTLGRGVMRMAPPQFLGLRAHVQFKKYKIGVRGYSALP